MHTGFGLIVLKSQGICGSSLHIGKLTGPRYEASKRLEPRENSWSALLFENNRSSHFSGGGSTLNLHVWRIWKIKEWWIQTPLSLHNQILMGRPATKNTWICLPLLLLLLILGLTWQWFHPGLTPDTCCVAPSGALLEVLWETQILKAAAPWGWGAT